MTFNPFKEKGVLKDEFFINWNNMYPKSYDKNEVDPYTRTRIILMNGTEFESNWFMHQFSRHCSNNELRRDLALVRRNEQQQQKKIACLKPIDESVLETTIGYEQLAVDLTAALAKMEPNEYVKQILDFALLEDFDHLYRFSDLLENDAGIHAERLVGKYTEIMPGRPTIAEHRHPNDDIRYWVDYKKADPRTKLHIGIITAAEQQTMNYYMNLGTFYHNDYGRKLFQEIGMIEEQHVSGYGSLMDPTTTWLECLLLHEYTECYLYYSCMLTETHSKIKKLWEENLTQELAHLHLAAKLLEKYENRTWEDVFTCGGDFPDILVLESNKDYVREVLENTVRNTSNQEEVVELTDLPENHEYFKYQSIVNDPVRSVPSHDVISNYIKKNGKDYRYQEGPHPIKELDNREKDNTEVGRVPGK